MSILKLRKPALATVLAIAIVSPTPAIDRSLYEKVLVPLSIPYMSGAHGSVWFSELYASNSGAVPADIYWQSGGCPFPPCTTFRVEPSRLIAVPAIRTSLDQPYGILLWVPKSVSSNITFHSRVMDLSRSAQNYGTEIPIVREGEFLIGRADLIQVPLDPRFRQTLRVYDLDDHASTQFRVQFISAAGDVVAGRLLATSFGDPGFEPPRFAPYAALHDFRSQIPELAGLDHVSLRIEPLDGSLHFWAFVSVTNNDTQLITTITPQ